MTTQGIIEMIHIAKDADRKTAMAILGFIDEVEGLNPVTVEGFCCCGHSVSVLTCSKRDVL